jgi:hypothetical protein
MAPRPAANPRKSARGYAANPESRRKKAAYDTKFGQKPDQRAKRAELATERRKRGMMGKGGPDLSHTKDGKLVREAPAANRGRNRSKK